MKSVPALAVGKTSRDAKTYQFLFVDEQDGGVGFKVDAGGALDDGEAFHCYIGLVGEAETDQVEHSYLPVCDIVVVTDEECVGSCGMRASTLSTDDPRFSRRWTSFVLSLMPACHAFHV